jgi:hypothetical protein
MRVLVQEIAIPVASTIGYGAGVDAAGGWAVLFCGDPRAMVDIQVALNQKADAPVFAMVEDWQVIGGSAGE